MKLSEITEAGLVQKDALSKQSMGLQRTLLPALPNIKSHALVISGIRRCGKSTLLHQFVKKQGRVLIFSPNNFFRELSCQMC
ncbi:MAG: AAA family ATPase [Spirochaetes bacterium]|nr:AAA family ATPase [Spirochaetota bacterium]